ncbi:potassium channel family protein [Pseudoalteromonas sp. MMG024]|uniref:potassium channel family protein n=1 Tax=Pseudoalteromonas sp. MMG024 TaxID=2909980 RepID=UPI0031BA1D3B
MLWLKRSRTSGQQIGQNRIFKVMLCLIFAHIVEICLFAFAYKLMLSDPKFGSLAGIDVNSITDYLYYSSIVFTTLGFGDIVPKGLIRLFTSIESLTGISLVAWSMSVAFLEIQHVEENKKCD